MAYKLMQFMCGTDTPQGYVLVGTDEHEGTSEPISVAEMNREATTKESLARFLNFRFLRAHGERMANASVVKWRRKKLVPHRCSHDSRGDLWAVKKRYGSCGSGKTVKTSFDGCTSTCT